MAKTERIVIEGGRVTMEGPDGQKRGVELPKFVEALRRSMVRGYSMNRLPRNTCFYVQADFLTVLILELQPQIRRFLWIDESGGKAKSGRGAAYKPRRLATPYIVLKVPFCDGRLEPRAELFYRNQPIADTTSQLYWPNLLNVSPNAYDCYAWICTQHLETDSMRPGIAAGLHDLTTHLWGGGWNRSSELNEGASTYSKAVADRLDPRVTDVDRWEEESLKDPRFVLGVSWKPVGATVGELIEKELKMHHVERGFGDASQWGDLLMSCLHRNSRNLRRLEIPWF